MNTTLPVHTEYKRWWIYLCILILQSQEGHIVMEYEKVLGAHIKDIRERRNMTQEILAELVGVTSQHISNIETGKTKVSLSTFIKIVNELNIPPEMVLAECMKIETPVLKNEIMDIIQDCSQKELKIIAEIIESSKVILRKIS